MKTSLFLISISLLLSEKFYASPDSEATPDSETTPDLIITPSPLTTTAENQNERTSTTEDIFTTRRRRRQTRGHNMNFTEAIPSGNASETTTEPLYYDDSESENSMTNPAPMRPNRTSSTTTRRRRQPGDVESVSNYSSKSDEEWYLKFRDRHSLPEPFQLPGRKRIVDLENMAYCRCPRVYWPVCAKNNITYLNFCIMDCLDQEIRRYGPCINYRRADDDSFGFLSD